MSEKEELKIAEKEWENQLLKLKDWDDSEKLKIIAESAISQSILSYGIHSEIIFMRKLLVEQLNILEKINRYH